MSERELKQIFKSGLNERVSKERRGGEGFSKLQNARLQERGNTFQVSRIEGYQQIAGDDTEFDVVYDSVVYDNDLVVYWYDSSSGEVVVTFIDIGGAGTSEKRFTDSQADYGELTLLEDNIYLTPYDKQLNYINGTWYLNDFISTTPTFTVSEVYEGSIEVVDGAGTDTYATGSIDITSQTTIVGKTATASITIQTSASGDCTVDTSFYGETVTTNITNGDSTSTIALKIRDDLATNSTISSDWTVTVNSNVVSIESDNIGSTWNGYSVSLVVNPITFSWSTDSPTSGGEGNVLTLTFPNQPSDTVLTDTIQTSDTQEDIAQKITDAINNKTGLDYSATRNTTTVDIEATKYGDQYNGTFAVTQEGLDFTYTKNDFTGGYKATGNFFTITFDTFNVDSDTFASGDTAEDLAQKVFNGLTSDATFNTLYDATLNGDTVTIRGSGTSSITVTEDITANNTTTNVQDVAVVGNLDQETHYWYKVRYAYYDGHKTITSYPQFVDTKSTQQTQLEIDIDETDLDGNVPDVEIFRKKEGNDFFLIERVTPTSTGSYFYTDNGKVNLQPLDERNYVWAENPLTQDIVRDRLVRANLEYSDKELGWSEGDVEIGKVTASGQVDYDTFPKNTVAEIFGQGRFNDGTLTPHKKLGEVDVGDELAQLETDPQNQPSNVDSLKEVAYYAKYKTKRTVNLSFNSLEIYNANIPSLATKFKPEEDQDRPVNPHVFLGYKYIKVEEEVTTTDTESTKRLYVIDQDWNYDGTNYIGTDDSTQNDDDEWFDQAIEVNTALWHDDPPEILDVNFNADSGSNLYENTTINYKSKYEELDGTTAGDFNYYIYELVIVEPLNKAINEGKTSIVLNEVLNSDQLSSIRSNGEFIDNEVDVVGLLDTSQTQQEVYDVTSELYNTGKNHVYLILDSDSIYSDVNNSDINNDGVLADHEAGGVSPNLEAVLNFDLVGVQYKDFGGNRTSQAYENDNTITEYSVDYGLVEFSPLSDDSDELLYLGTQDEFDEDNGTQYFGYYEGYDTIKENLFEYQVLLGSSIFEQIIFDEDLEQFQEDYPNQLVWGGSYILESNASGTRDFGFTNFKNISQDYGEIVAISYINNVLLVFCERGVNRINIGEVLTQQSDSQVFVDSSTLLNNDQWILKNVPDIKARSVTQYENMLFFCDGKDVWKYTNQLENVSSGKVDFDIDETFEGSIDPKNKEYQLTNGDQTWVYSIELDLWQGPFTYKIETASAYRDNFYGVVGSDSVEFNSGNDFDGTSYDTVIESVANTLDDASVTKLFRKFYVETEEDATFSYGKEYGTWTDKTLSNYPSKNGVTHLGVNPSNKNGRQMYWKVTTQQQDFILQLVSLLLDVRKRR